MPTRRDPGKVSGTRSQATGILGRGCVGVMFRGNFRLVFHFLTVILAGLRYFSFQLFRNMRRDVLYTLKAGSVLSHPALSFAGLSVILDKNIHKGPRAIVTDREMCKTRLQVSIKTYFFLLYSLWEHWNLALFCPSQCLIIKRFSEISLSPKFEPHCESGCILCR